MQDDWTDDDLTLEKILEKIRENGAPKTDAEIPQPGMLR